MTPSKRDSRGTVAALVAFVVALLVAGTLPVGAGPLPSGSLGLWEQAAKVTPDDAHRIGPAGTSHAFVYYGSSLSLDSDTLAVGTATDGCDWATWAYVFERSTDGAWDQTGKLLPDDGAFSSDMSDECSSYGYAVDVDEDAGRVVVGHPTWPLPHNASSPEDWIGAIYVFDRQPNGSWVETAKLTGPSTDGNLTAFGLSVAVDGDRLAVGAPGDDPNGMDAGSVTVYTLLDGSWSRTAKLAGDTPSGSFGSDIEMSQGTLAVGNPFDDTGNPKTHGAAEIFERSDGAWSKTATISEPAPIVGETDACFGCALALSADADTLVLGDQWNDKVAGLVPVHPADSRYNVGTAYVYKRSDGEWDLDASLSNPKPLRQESYAESVGVNEDGSMIVVGAPWDPVNPSPMSPQPGPAGSGYVFEEGDTGWSLAGRLRADDTGTGDFFGRAVSASEDKVVASAPMDDNRRDGRPWPFDDDGGDDDEGEDAGSVYVFRPLLQQV